MKTELEQQKDNVRELREYLDFQYKMAEKYGCSNTIRNAIEETHTELSKIENINTMRPEDFIRFANGDFGFI